MGEGWTDVWRPAVWQAVAGTRFGECGSGRSYWRGSRLR